MADTANNKQFSVMVNNSGAISYPQNFITANSLAKFGSDVDGILKSLNTTKVGGLTGTEYIEFTPMDESYNGSAISFYTHDGASIPQKRFEINAALAHLEIPYGNIELVSTDGISLDTSGNIELVSTDGISLDSGGMIEVLSKLQEGDNGGVEIGLSYSYYDEIFGGDKTINNNVLITKDKISVSAPLVELPANTTIGGKTIATGAPSNMVTTDTEQTITGKKSFTNISLPSQLPVYGLVQDAHFYEGDLTTSSINLCYNYTEINAKNEGLFLKCSNVGFYDATGNFENELMAVKSYGPEVEFSVPQRLRVFNTVTKKWTDTYKYTYLAQDANGNITLAISDTHPSASV